MRLVRLLVFASALSTACGGRPPAVAEAEREPKARLACDEDDDERLVVDWSPLDRGKLEAAASRGVVAVRIDGCRARFVDTCTVKRSYVFAATSRQREVMVVRDRDELGARLPILATRIGGAFARAASVDVSMTVVGRYDVGAGPVPATDLEGDCAAVTHVVSSMSVGAFAIATRDATSVEAGVADFAHASRASERRRLDAAGLEEQCALARRSDAAPPEDCAIPLRIELRRVSENAPSTKKGPTPAALDVVDMKRAMENAKRQLVPCHRAARATSPDLSGVLTLAVKLGRRGNVRSVSAKHEGNLDDELAECAAQRVAMVSFPEGEDDRPRSVVIPILFAPLRR